MESKESWGEETAESTTDSAESAQSAGTGGTGNTGKERGCQECPVREWTEALRAVEGTMRGILPPAFWQHRRAAQKEALLAVRSLLDAAIERADREPQVRQARAPKKITVQ
jgi:hypothetical protein